MFTRRIPLFRLLGFQVWIDWSWFILAVLITWTLATQVFPGSDPDHPLAPPATLWTMGAIGALGLFVSIVLHELGHSVVARQFGMRMRGITLFIFGGVAEMLDEPPSAKAEFFMAIAGPAVSVVLGGALLGAAVVAGAGGMPVEVVKVAAWLGTINIILACFNIVPAFPLDGGRVLRAILWQAKGDMRWATKVTASIGGMFGMMMIVLGAVVMVLGGNFIGGFWWIILGLFLRHAAAGSYQQVLVRRALEGETVSRFMTRDPVVVPAGITVQQLVEQYFYRHYHKMYPVTDGDQLIGCITAAHVKATPHEHRATLTVRDVAEPCTADNTISSGADAMHALGKLSRSGASRLLVVDDGRLVGILSLKDLMQFLSLRVELGDG